MNPCEIVASADLVVGRRIDIDIVVELADLEFGVAESLLLDLAHLGAHVIVDGLELFGRGDAVVGETLREGRDRIALLAHFLDLLALAVAGARVAHRVA